MSERSIVVRNWIAAVLAVVACLQMAGDLLGIRELTGLAAAWGVSPRPKVFSDVKGLEPYASSFVLTYRDGGRQHSQAITPELYSKLSGPYNRRNVYGAALSYGPRLPDELWRPVYCFGLQPGGPLRDELGVPTTATHLAVDIQTNTRGRGDRWRLEDECAR